MGYGIIFGFPESAVVPAFVVGFLLVLAPAVDPASTLDFYTNYSRLPSSVYYVRKS